MKCFYHADNDGKASAFCVYAWVGIKNEEAPSSFIPMVYSTPFPMSEIVKDEQVWIVDFSISPDEMTQLLQITKDVTWIDHHKTAIEKFKNFPTHIKGIRKDGEAGCVLTWKYVHWYSGRGSDTENFEDSENAKIYPVPRYIDLIGDRDIWAFKYGDESRKFFAASVLYDLDPSSDFWWKCENKLNTDFWHILLLQGNTLLQASKMQAVERVKANAFLTTLDGFEMLALNHWPTSSEAFGGDELFTKHTILCCFYYTGTKFSVSLYSQSVDVSTICKAHGGGGHKGAAGFICDTLPFTSVNKEVK